MTLTEEILDGTRTLNQLTLCRQIMDLRVSQRTKDGTHLVDLLIDIFPVRSQNTAEKLMSSNQNQIIQL